jgi:hypothetical protein
MCASGRGSSTRSWVALRDRGGGGRGWRGSTPCRCPRGTRRRVPRRESQHRRSDSPSGGPPGPDERSRTNRDQGCRDHGSHEADLWLGLNADAHDHASGQDTSTALTDDRSDHQPPRGGRAHQVEGRGSTKCPTASAKPEEAVQAASRNLRTRPPPTSREMSAARIAVTAAASAEGVRSSGSDPGAIACIAQHSNGTSGGWSG